MEIPDIESEGTYADLTRYPTASEGEAARIDTVGQNDRNTVWTVPNVLKVVGIASVTLSSIAFCIAALPLLIGPFGWGCFAGNCLLILVASLLGGSAWRR